MDIYPRRFPSKVLMDWPAFSLVVLEKERGESYTVEKLLKRNQGCPRWEVLSLARCPKENRYN